MKPSTGSWEVADVRGHSCDVFRPAQPQSHGEVLIYLHGVHLTRLVDNPLFSRQFDMHGLPVVAPNTGPSWWTDRICPAFDDKISPEHYVMKEVVPAVERLLGSPVSRLGIFGTSMGGQGALRLAYRFPETFPVVAAIAPAVDFQHRLADGDEVLAAMYDDVEQARQDTALLHVHPLNWPRHQFFCCDPEDERWYESADRLRMKLASLGIPLECDLDTRAGGHSFDYYNAMAERVVGFLAEGLKRERLRLV